MTRIAELKWPVLGQVLIGLCLVGSVRGVLIGVFFGANVLRGLIDAIGLIIYWNVYKMKPWALVAFNIFVSLMLLFGLFVFLGGLATSAFLDLGLLIQIALSITALIYFNSSKSKELLKSPKQVA